MAYFFRNVPFPESAWSPGMKQLADEPTRHLPKDWYRAVVLRAPPPAGFAGAEMIEADCRAVFDLARFRASRLTEIDAEAGMRWDAIARVQQVLGPVRTATTAMIDAAIDDLTCGVFRFKIDFARGRPYQCCDLPINPLYQTAGDTRYPGHPSYPSGHSSQAFTTALLYAHLFPKLRCSLLAAARRTAHNREIAGLHFPSDTEAGLELSSQFVAMLLKSKSFEPLLDAACAEWPELA